MDAIGCHFAPLLFLSVHAITSRLFTINFHNDFVPFALLLIVFFLKKFILNSNSPLFPVFDVAVLICYFFLPALSNILIFCPLYSIFILFQYQDAADVDRARFAALERKVGLLHDSTLYA